MSSDILAYTTLAINRGNKRIMGPDTALSPEVK
jgi:hypothetical protein